MEKVRDEISEVGSCDSNYIYDDYRNKYSYGDGYIRNEYGHKIGSYNENQIFDSYGHQVGSFRDGIIYNLYGRIAGYYTGNYGEAAAALVLLIEPERIAND